MEIEAYKIAFGVGATICAVSAVILAGIQLRKGSKDGIYTSVFKGLDANEIQGVKLSGALFIGGILIIILGVVLHNAL